MGIPLLWLFPSFSWAAGQPSMPSGMPASGAAGAGGPAHWWTYWQLIAAAVVLVLAVVLWLVGQATHSRYLKPGWVSGVGLLLLAYLITSFVIVAYKKPGQTTVIEAQSMDMYAMRPPTGTVPVATEIVQPRDFAPGVTYTGTVVALNDEDVYPRVPGTIVSLPVYPGDRVTPGELLVKLDDAEYSAREREAQWDREMAGRATTTSQREQEMAIAGRQQADAEVGKANEDLRVMQREVNTADSMIKESQSEIAQAGHSLEAGRKELESAQAAREQAQATAAMASADIEAAQGDVASAQADVTYWEQEIKRAKQLLDLGAYSTDDYQRERSQYQAAQAKLAQTQAMVRQKKQALAAAQAAIKQSDAAVAGAQARVAAMGSEVEKTQAGLEKAQAEKSTAQARVASAQAMVRSAQAMRDEKSAGVRASGARVAEAAAAVPQRAAALTAARTVRGYTEIRATRPGSVIQRLVSPGVLVQPGTPILRIAQIDRVRLQAYVSPSAISALRVGDPVEAASPKLPGGLLRAAITSISPAADPTTRTSVVEAVVDNSSRVLYPGDAITLKLLSGRARRVLTVPNSALVTKTVPTGGPASAQQATVWLVVTETHAAGKVTYTCVMHPEIHAAQPGKCPKCGMDLVPEKPTGASGGGKRAHQAPVTLGATDGTRTEVVSGLSAGNEVITQGLEALQEGEIVYPVPWTDRGPAALPPGAMTGGPSTAPAPSGGAHSGMKM